MTTRDAAARSTRPRRPDAPPASEDETFAYQETVPPRFALFVTLIQHGESVREAASRSGLSSDQVLQWLEDDATVIAALSSTRTLIEKQIRFRLLALAHKAVEAIDQALEKGDARIALDLLVSLDLASGEGGLGTDLDAFQDAEQTSDDTP